MINHIAVGQYYPGNSLLHRLDPRTKITALFIYMAALFIAKDFWAYGILVLVALGALLFSRVSLAVFFRSLRILFFFILFAAFFNIFFTPGEVLWEWGVLSLTKEGLLGAAFMALRLILLIGMASLLTFTTTPMALTDALENMLRPVSALGFPGHELAMMMSIALRFIPTLLEEAEKIRKAQMSRGIVLGRGPIKEMAKAAIPFLVPLFTGAFRRADELAYAMEARAYRGGKGRVKLKVLKMEGRDIVTLAFMILITVALILYRWWI